ncbi:unnamed protein product, partial [Mesorhabditis belari]|uniref:Phosphoserine phosphatase n=1 Tax=Mesorhabditis belari TaxID=2138241 RepID=A0AAF3FLP1_9BILA
MLRVSQPPVLRNDTFEKLLTNSFVKNEEHLVKNVWKKADAVCFDMDDTVAVGDSNAEIAEFLGFGDIAKATQTAMNAIHKPLSLDIMDRFDRMRPSRQQLNTFLNQRSLRITSGAKPLIKLLHAQGKEVFLLTSGFYEMAFPVAELLGISRENVFANSLLFDATGQYLGVETSVTKGDVITRLKRENRYENVVMIGDGTNDLMACPPAEAFVGFGGNQVRPNVLAAAKWYVMDFETLQREIEN